MSEYIVSARKYRPNSFESLVGQDNIARTLKNSILRGQLSHAYLFCGPRGVGKTSTARIFAKAINCSNPGENMEPCGECESCRSFSEGRSFCIHELDAASNNGVEDIKALMEQVQVPPQTGKYSVFIIDEVHMLSTAAFNAFLKTLEEPPAHAIFILATTEKHKVLPTILSRCQTYDFNRISIPDIVRNLRQISVSESVDVDDESLHVMAAKADGAMRDALTIFDQMVAFCGTTIRYDDVIRNLNVLDSEYGFKLTDCFLAGDYGTAMLVLDEVLRKGFNPLYFLSCLGEHFRDLLVSRTGGLDSLLEKPSSLKKRFVEQASRCSVKFIYDALAVVNACEAQYKGSVNQRLLIEYSLMRLAFIGSPSGIAAAGTTAVAKERADAPAAVPAAAPDKAGTASANVAAAATTAVAKERADAPAAVPAAAPDKAGTASANVAAAATAPVAENRADAPAAVPAAAPAEDNSAAAVSATAPDTAAAEVASGKRVRRSVVSLDAMISSEGDGRSVAAEMVSASEFTQETLDKVWEQVAVFYDATTPRLASAIRSSRAVLGEVVDGKQIVSFEVMNQSQKDWIEEKKLREMEGILAKGFGRTDIKLQITLQTVGQKPQTAYLPREQAKEMIEKNAVAREFVKDFELDIK